MDPSKHSNELPIAAPAPLGYSAAAGLADVPLLRPILVAAMVSGTLLALMNGGALVAWAVHWFTGRSAVPAGTGIYHAARAVQAVAALVMTVGAIGCLRLNRSMRRVAMSAALALVAAALSTRIAYTVTIYLSFVGPSILQAAIALLGGLIEAGVEAVVPALLWFALRRADVAALYLGKRQ